MSDDKRARDPEALNVKTGSAAAEDTGHAQMVIEARNALREAFVNYQQAPNSFATLKALRAALNADLEARGVPPEEFMAASNAVLPTCEKIFPSLGWKDTAELTAQHPKFGNHPVCICDESKGLSEVMDRMLNRTQRIDFCDGQNRSVAAAVWGPIEELHARGIAIQKLAIVAGESGSGKTMLALCGPPTMPNYVTLYFNGLKFPPVLGSNELPGRGENQQLEKAFVQGVVSAVKRKFLLGKLAPADGRQALRLHLVFDEMGPSRNELRLLCRLRKEICSDVLSACQAATVSMIALGTGVNVIGRKVGSDINTFEIHTLRNDPCVWRDFLQTAEAKFTTVDSDRLLATLKQIAKLEMVDELTGNPRAAGLLCDELKQTIVTGGVWDTTVIRCSVGHFMTRVAARYKAMSGLSSLSVEQLRVHLADALRYVMCPSTQPSPIDAPELQLVNEFGMLVDLSVTQVKIDVCKRNPKLRYFTIPNEPDVEVSVPMSGRFTMSPAIGVLAAIFVGAFRPVSLSLSTSGEELELLAAMKAALVLTCVRTVAEAHEAMGFDKASRYDSSDAQSLSKTLRLTSSAEAAREVVVFRCEHRISRGNNTKKNRNQTRLTRNGAKEVDRIRQALYGPEPAGNKRNAIAVVAINCAGAPYADVIVVAPGLLWLLQLKDWLKEVPVGNQQAELRKIADKSAGTPTGELLKIAGCKQAMFGILARSGWAQGWTTSQEEHVVTSALHAASALRPLRMPERSAIGLPPGIPGVMACAP